MRICEANTRILRANYQPNIDAMAIRHLSPAPILQRHPKPAENRTLCRARALKERRANAEWDALSQRWPKRKVHPGIYAQNGIRFPEDASSGNCIPESTLEMGFIFRMNGWRKVHPGICHESGTRFPNGSSCSLGRSPAQPPRPLSSKTRALSISKLGRRRPKRNGRRST